MSRFANCLVIVAIGLLGLVAPSEADPGQITELTYTMAIGINPNLCPSWPYTETISGKVKLQVMLFREDNANNAVTKYMVKPMAGSLCTGTESGATWRVEGTTQSMVHHNIDGLSVFKYIPIFKLVGVPDPALHVNPPNYFTKALAKVTINANGEVTVDRESEPETTCA